MENYTFHHALKILDEVCTGCTHCIKVCPTEALRVRNGKAVLSADRCVDCGECMRACPINAIIVEQDDFCKIFNFKYKVAIVPSVFIGQFPRNIPTREIYSALHELGFTHVFESEHGTRILSEEISNYQKKFEDVKPLISSFCPAVVRLIQVKFPTLVEHIMLLKAPLDLAAIAYRKRLTDEGIDNKELGIFYITPCAAKIAAVKSPVGEEISAINGVINMNFLFNKVYPIITKNNKISCPVPEKEQLRDKEMLWSLTHGETVFAQGRSIAIDGIDNVIEFLEKLENNSLGVFDFLELRACDQSCAGGILTTTNRFLTVERLNNRAQQFLKDNREVNTEKSTIKTYKSYLLENIALREVNPRSGLKLDEDMKIAMDKMMRTREINSHLPGIDCGACGSPNCSALAEDIVQDKADISNCVFIQDVLLSHGDASSESLLERNEKTWGKDRFKNLTVKNKK